MAMLLNIVVAFLAVSVSAETDRFDVKFEESLPQGFDQGSDSNRIIGGSIANRGQFPYIAALVVSRDGIATICTGALISNTSVLTSAGCVAGASFVDVSLGAQSIRNTSETGRVNVRVPSEHVIVHAGYNADSAAYDIAILRLPNPVEPSSMIKPIQLPTFSEVTSVLDGEIVFVAGWGLTTNDATYGVSEELRYATVRFESFDVCKYYYGNRALFSNICARTTDGKGTCRGDVGAPATTNNKIYGISSFVNPHGCVNCLPSVLTKVTYFLDWIEANSDVVVQLQ